MDEAGRGPLAGPVVAAAVVVKRGKLDIDQRVNDSKKLSPKKREELFDILTKHPSIEWGMGKVSERMIDKTNILKATKLAMAKAVKKVSGAKSASFLILDGNMSLDLAIEQKSIIKADEKVFSCAAASIIAKVTRDRIMQRYAKKYPQYLFEQHKGYPTALHRKMLKKQGPCPIHRQSFRCT